MAKWTEEEIQYLKDNYAHTDIKILSEKLNRSKDAIYMKGSYLGLEKERVATMWTEEETKYLKDNYADTDNEILAKRLNRSEGAVSVKSTYLGLKKREENLVGNKYGKLTVISRNEDKSHLTYTCLCDCGNEITVIPYSLKSGNTKSCGCYKKLIFNQTLEGYLDKNAKDGTVLNIISSKKPNKRNTSGHKGVSWSKQHKKWETYITFQGKRKHLGLYADKQDAIKARLKAEEEYFVPILEKYKDVFEQ